MIFLFRFDQVAKEFPSVGFAKAVRLAKTPHIRFHDLRHTFAMRLVHAGVDLVTVKTLLGHTKITTTARYAHCLFDDKMSAVMRLEKRQPVRFSGQPDANRSPNPVG